MVKKGDTLIEVTIAIGIFSLIAIGVATVMSSGTAGSQTSLETTLAREEVDAQAEALRFVHESYISGKDASSNPYSALWKKITSSAQSASSTITQFNPSSCQSLYGNPSGTAPLASQKAFVLNTRNLSAGESAYVGFSTNKLTGTSTYPRILYGISSTLAGLENSTTLNRAEGIYVVAVKDNGTNIIGYNSKTTAFYDFYIRTCWYGTDSERPSTVSTVIRLYDPPAAQNTTPVTGAFYRVYFDNTMGTFQSYIDFPPGANETLSRPASDRFVRWVDNDTGAEVSTITVPDSITSGQFRRVTAEWNLDPYPVTYNANGGAYSGNSSTFVDNCAAFAACESAYSLPSNLSTPTRSGYKFLGWSLSSTATSASYQAGNYYGALPIRTSPNGLTFYAVWRENNETYSIELKWNASIDYDSYIYGQKMSGGTFTAYYGMKAPTETVSGVTRTLAQLDHDCTGSCTPNQNETFTINTLGGKDFYYYVRNYSNDSNITSATVTLKRQDGNTWTTVATYNASSASGNGRVWNVFAYKNGSIVQRQTRSASSDASGTGGAQLSY